MLELVQTKFLHFLPEGGLGEKLGALIDSVHSSCTMLPLISENWS